MQQALAKFLLSYQKKKISILELETLIPSKEEYEMFVQAILSLVQEGILSPVKSHGVYQRHYSLSNTYSIQKNVLRMDYHEQLRRTQLHLHPAIQLSAYFTLPEDRWQKDQPLLLQLHHYLVQHGLPETDATAEERGYDIIKDEKWITEGDGKAFLERVGLYQSMKIISVTDPLMFAVNPAQMQEPQHLHLIIENKTTYDALSPALVNTPFTTLIYGAGKGFLSSIRNLKHQLNLPHAKHTLFYFGDFDRAGIDIWYSLYVRQRAEPSLAFYQALLELPYSLGKSTQSVHKDALDMFLSHFPAVQQKKIVHMFQNGGYYPQEALKADELRTIWRNSTWKK